MIKPSIKSVIEKNQTQPTRQQKSLENSAPLTEKAVYPKHNPRTAFKQAQSHVKIPVEENEIPSSSYQINATNHCSYASVAVAQPRQKSR